MSHESALAKLIFLRDVAMPATMNNPSADLSRITVNGRPSCLLGHAIFLYYKDELDEGARHIDYLDSFNEAADLVRAYYEYHGDPWITSIFAGCCSYHDPKKLLQARDLAITHAIEMIECEYENATTTSA